jgi:hypothetical protein
MGDRNKQVADHDREYVAARPFLYLLDAISQTWNYIIRLKRSIAFDIDRFHRAK